jgi:hypothetical protein
MNTRHLTSALAALAITVSSTAFANEIYKWTDQDGNVHYEDRPSGDPSEERLQLSYNRTNSTTVQGRIETQRDSANARREAREEAEVEELSAAEERAAAEQRLAQCQSYRARLKKMLESRRVYREDDAGERTYLDEAQRAEARTTAENLIKETCGT